MEKESCWKCGSQMLKTSVERTEDGGWVSIKCTSCFTKLIVTPIGGAKNGLPKLPGKDGKSL